MKKRALGWSLIQYGWCPYENGKFGAPKPTYHRYSHVNVKVEIGMVFL